MRGTGSFGTTSAMHAPHSVIEDIDLLQSITLDHSFDQSNNTSTFQKRSGKYRTMKETPFIRYAVREGNRLNKSKIFNLSIL